MKVHNKVNLLTVATQHISLGAVPRPSSFLHSTASSFRLVEATVLRGKWMNRGFMEMRKCNGALFSIPAAGTVALCVFYQRHERRTISLSAINNMVSFEADYPSVEVKGNKRLGDNWQSLEPRFLLPGGNPPFCFAVIQKNLICPRAHSYEETFRTRCPERNAKFKFSGCIITLWTLLFVLDLEVVNGFCTRLSTV